MGKHIFIAVLLVGIFAKAQVINPSSVILVQSSGINDPNRFIATSASDFTSPDPSNVDKVWEVRTTIDMGGSNFNLPKLIHFNGGKLTNYGTATLVNTSITSIDGITPIFDASGDFAGIGRGDVWMNWFGLVGDDSTDNRQSILNAMAFVNSSGGNAYVTPDDNGGMFEASVVASAPDLTVTNFGITGNGTSIIGVPGATGRPKFKMKGHSNSGAYFFHFWFSENASIENIEVYGDRYEHVAAGGSTTDEGIHNIVVGAGNKNFKISNVKTWWSTADGIYFNFNPNFLNSHSSADYTQGNINGSTGSSEVDSNWMYSNAIFPVTATEFNQLGYFALMGNSYGNPFPFHQFYAVYYGASDAFVGKSELLTMYDPIPIPDGVDGVRIIVPYTSIVDTMRVGAPNYSMDGLIEYCDIGWNERQGISNPNRTRIVYNKIHNTGEKSPARAIDIEDFYQGLKHVLIAFNIFFDNHNGDITGKSPQYITIHDNIFDINGRYAFTDSEAVSTNGTGLQVNSFEFSTFYSNVYKNRDVVLGKGNVSSNDVIHEGEVRLYNQETKIQGGAAWNTKFVYVDPSYIEGNSYIEDYNLYFDRPLDDYVFSHKGSFVVKNVVMDFHNQTYTSQSITNLFNLVTDGSEPVDGHIDGLTIKNYEVPDASKATDAGFPWYAQDLKGLDISIPLYVRYGAQKDITISGRVKGRIRLRLDQFSTDGSLTTNVYLKDLTIDADHTNYDDSTSEILEIGAVDVNLYASNTVFNLASGVTNVFGLGNSGAKVFDNCHFKSPDSFSVTATGFIFRNCTFDAGGGTITMTGATIE